MSIDWNCLLTFVNMDPSFGPIVTGQCARLDHCPSCAAIYSTYLICLSKSKWRKDNSPMEDETMLFILYMYSSTFLDLADVHEPLPGGLRLECQALRTGCKPKRASETSCRFEDATTSTSRHHDTRSVKDCHPPNDGCNIRKKSNNRRSSAVFPVCACQRDWHSGQSSQIELFRPALIVSFCQQTAETRIPLVARVKPTPRLARQVHTYQHIEAHHYG